MRSVGLRTWFALGVAVAATAVAAGGASAAQGLRTVGWETYRNARYGFAIAYPPGLFQLAESGESDSGRLFQSNDGRARLLVGALANGDGLDLKAYRAFVKSETYPGARFDYEPVGRAWFVLSGTRGEDHFYQWVTFLCGGKLINSWAMTYPAAERRRYDPIVEAVAKTFRPSGGSAEECR